ncbi:NAD(P)-binding domain-containing protein [Flavobacterium sp. N1719]|uniref:NAD(P)-binding domain-containing protein n=1 Tax=Flavobacterium sp. N1719 TaxID=2885633 RepID=UPI002223B85C|nr:NAD(P)-binding domain-containing protein [Flavobacterium sp. N1719]
MKETIGILGCGWLGFPLAQSLVEKGYRVKGTSTTIDKCVQLTAHGIDAFHIAINENDITGDWDNFVNGLDQLLINIPPRLRKDGTASYVSKVELLLKNLPKNQPIKIIWVSSTSVFSDFQETITDQTVPQPDTESGKELARAEECIQNSGFPFTIVRFGGLIGKDRHPIKYLSGRKNNERPDAPVNLIELNDCISILEECIHREAINQSLNAVHPEHPSRKAYYMDAAQSRNLPLPEFDETDRRSGKCIHPDYLLENWKYIFQVRP